MGERYDDNEGAAVGSAVMLGTIITALGYLGIKTFADWLGLDWQAAIWLLGGIITLVAGVLIIVWKQWPLGQLLPWMLCGFFIFAVPALDYWARRGPANLFHQDADDAHIAWYGHAGWQFVMFVVLCCLAASLHVLQRDRY